MTDERAEYDASPSWHDRVRVMSLYHYGQVASQDIWLIKDTAHYFGISSSTVAENLLIAHHLPELKDIGSRNKALKKLRGIKIK